MDIGLTLKIFFCLFVVLAGIVNIQDNLKYVFSAIENNPPLMDKSSADKILTKSFFIFVVVVVVACKLGLILSTISFWESKLEIGVVIVVFALWVVASESHNKNVKRQQDIEIG